MYNVTHEELKAMMVQCHRAKKPLFIWGATGIGKSRVTKDLTVNKKIGFIDVRLSQMDPSDLRGLPTLSGERTKWLPPEWLPESGEGMLFLDELNLAPPSIQASAYELVLDRRIGSYTLPDGWSVFAAGNRIEDRAQVFEMSGPLCNRFLHVELSKPFVDQDHVDKGWTGWAIKNNVDIRIVNFLLKNPSLLFKFDEELKEKAFPTPRSWEMVSDLVKGVNSNNLPMLQMMTSAAVGEGVSRTFTAFIKLGRSIDLKKVFANPEVEVKKITEVDMKFALVNELTNYYQGKKDNKNYVEVLGKVIPVLNAEFSIRLIQLSIGIGKQPFIKALVNHDNSDKIITKYGKYLN